jgi:hypothetical protein
MEGQQNLSLSVNTYIERHINVVELFNFSRLHVDDMAGILQDLDLVGSTTGLNIKNIKDRYADYRVEGTFVWVTWWEVVGLSILGLGGIFWCLLKSSQEGQERPPTPRKTVPIFVFHRQNRPGTRRCRNAANTTQTRKKMRASYQAGYPMTCSQAQ